VIIAGIPFFYRWRKSPRASAPPAPESWRPSGFCFPRARIPAGGDLRRDLRHKHPWRRPQNPPPLRVFNIAQPAARLAF